MLQRLRTLARHRRVVVGVQLAALAILLAFLAWAVRDVWPDAAPRIRDASALDLGLSLLVLAAYYLVFVVGWMLILASMGIRVPYTVALQAEMLSMLAKYVPGGVWTPAARVVAMRRFGVEGTPVLIASILLEAGLSAVAGVLVFLASLPFVGVPVEAPLGPVLIFGAVVTVLLHPRVFRWLAVRVLKPFGGAAGVQPLPYRDALGILAFYMATWPLGGVAFYFMLRAVGGDPDAASIPFLGGVAAVGAIVAVLAVFAPSGLGVREATMYGLVLAVASTGVALGATVVNRFAITIVEAALLVIGAALSRGRMWTRSAEPAAVER